MAVTLSRDKVTKTLQGGLPLVIPDGTYAHSKNSRGFFGGVAVSAIISPLPWQKAPPRQGHTVTQLPFEYGNRLLCVFCSCFWLLENVSLQSSGYAGYGYQYVGVSSRQPFSVFENASVIVSLSPSSSLSTSTFTYSPFDGFTIFIVS